MASIEVGTRVIDVDGVQAHILEVLKTSTPWSGDEYHVVVKLTWNNVSTRNFTIDVKNERELIAKLRIEASKMKLFKFLHGEEALRKVATS
ncbi:MAG: hypothetical protein ACXQTF_00430 [Candidatus Hecatellaceae archaeon]